MRRLAVVLSCVVCFMSAPAYGADKASVNSAFIPEQPVIRASEVKSGMKGYMLTVMRGTEPISLPLEVVDVVPQKGSLNNVILIRLLPSENNRVGGVARGMSGSPVYFGGKLAGAVGSGWSFSDHNIALVTPIEDMCDVFSRPDKPINLKNLNLLKDNLLGSVIGVSGLSEYSVKNLEKSIGLPVMSSPSASSGVLVPRSGEKLKPGQAVSALLVWGDVEAAATGTVTATSKDGRFLAFGHSFTERGAVNFPAARAKIYETIGSQAFPFKLASPSYLIGTITQDRAAGIGGRLDYFTPSISAQFYLNDLDTSRKDAKSFRVAPDAFLAPALLNGIYEGLIDDGWERKGQGTMNVTLRVEGRGIENGWTRTNIFFSDEDVARSALKETERIIELFMLQPFREVMPVGFRLDVSVTEEPKVLFIEDVCIAEDAFPGDELNVEVTLRPWRKKTVKKYFTVTVPKNATGVCELIVRGGSVTPLAQVAIEGGWKSIDSFKRVLTEISAVDANNELIVELLCDPASLKSDKDDDKKDPAELLPEEKEFLSETKARRIKEGTLHISRSEYFVDGLLKRLVKIKHDDD